MPEKFIPKPKSPPAKVKDRGLIELVMSGGAVYNAKSQELILLPKGAEEAAELRSKAAAALFDALAVQRAECGGNEGALYSLAERFARDYGEKALAWGAGKGMDYVFAGWSSDAKSAKDKAGRAAAVFDALSAQAGAESVSELCGAALAKNLIVSPADKGSLDTRDGYVCPRCGKILLPDSPYEPENVPPDTSPEEPLEEVPTPGANTMDMLCEQLGMDIRRGIRAMLYTIEEAGGEKEILFIMMRGDNSVSMAKLEHYVAGIRPGSSVRRAEADEILSGLGDVAGFCGPVGAREDALKAADIALEGGKNFVVGANRQNYHKKGCCWGRDFTAPLADLTLVEKGKPCPHCGAPLEETALRVLAETEAYRTQSRGEPTLSFRGREGTSEWPYKWRGELHTGSLLLGLYESKNKAAM